MKKIKVLGLLTLSVFLLSACSTEKKVETTKEVVSESSTEILESSTEELSQSAWIEKNVSGLSSYKDDTLTLPEGVFKFTDSKYFTTEGGVPVVLVRFSFTNTTDQQQRIESIVWNRFAPKQIFENTTEQTGFYMLTPDDDYYEEYNNSQVEINPGGTVDALYGFSLKNDTSPLTLYLSDENGTVIGVREYNLK